MPISEKFPSLYIYKEARRSSLQEEGNKRRKVGEGDAEAAKVAKAGATEFSELLNAAVELSNDLEPFESKDHKERYKLARYAAKWGCKDIVVALVRQYPELLEEKTNKGYTLAHIAVQFNHMATLDGLLTLDGLFTKYPELLKEKTNEGYTLAHIAVQFNHMATLDGLLAKYPKLLKEKTNEGYTLAHIAVQFNHMATLDGLLTKYPELFEEKTNKGYTLKDIALQFHRKDILNLLINIELKRQAQMQPKVGLKACSAGPHRSRLSFSSDPGGVATSDPEGMASPVPSGVATPVKDSVSPSDHSGVRNTQGTILGTLDLNSPRNQGQYGPEKTCVTPVICALGAKRRSVAFRRTNELEGI